MEHQYKSQIIHETGDICLMERWSLDALKLMYVRVYMLK